MNNHSKSELFTPVGDRSLGSTYPELNAYPELKDLNSEQMRFCWMVGCFYSHMPDDQAIKMAVENSPLGQALTDKDQQMWKKNNMPDEIKNGVARFRSMDISARLQSKFISETVLQNYQKLVSTDINEVGVVVIYDDDNTTQVGYKRDWQQVASYVSTTEKIMAALPNLLETIERSYGITKKTRKLETSNVRDEYQHRQIQRNK